MNIHLIVLGDGNPSVRDAAKSIYLQATELKWLNSTNKKDTEDLSNLEP